MHDAAVGIDGCPGGWIAATWRDGTVTWSFVAVGDVGAVIPDDTAVGIDMPIGLVASGLRGCDALARRELPGASSRVFTTPPRPVLELGPHAPNADVQALSRALTGQGVSRQAMNLGPRILALDAVLAARPAIRVVEVHPELSFAEMTGRVLPSKRTAEGVESRRAALRKWLPGLDAIVAGRPAHVPALDAVDALAALWSAARWRDGQVRTLPVDARERPFVAI